MNDKIKLINKLNARVKALRPFSQGELERLREEFLIEYTYDSNAIEGSPLTLEETVLPVNITS